MFWSFPYVAGVYQTPAGLPWSLTTSGTGSSLVFSLTNILTSEVLKFNNQGWYISDTDAYGNVNTVTQSGTRNPTLIANSGGRALTMTYTAYGLLASTASPQWTSGGAGQMGSQQIAYGYDGNFLSSMVWGAQSSDQQTAHFRYTGDLMTGITTPMTLAGTLAVQRNWTLGYDGSNRLTSITSPISGTVGQAGYTPAYTTQIQLQCRSAPRWWTGYGTQRRSRPPTRWMAAGRPRRSPMALATPGTSPTIATTMC